MSDWKPGTVAKATVRGVPDVTVFRVVQIHPDHVYLWAVAAKIAETTHFRDEDITDVRPLVVLDLDESQGKDWLPGWLRSNISKVEQGCVSPSPIGKDMAWLADQIEAQTKPPRIPEPGPWGVVEAGTSKVPMVRRWVRYGTGWRDAFGGHEEWDNLLEPVLVREGIDS